MTQVKAYNKLQAFYSSVHFLIFLEVDKCLALKFFMKYLKDGVKKTLQYIWQIIT